MTQTDLQKVNDFRSGKIYVDKEAALEVFKETKKMDLKESPFIRRILIGVNNDGYWNSRHMAIQLEDCVDCLKVLYPEMDFVFLFDHSQGHSRKREGGLHVAKLNVSYGGSQSRMRTSKITAGCLGVYSPLLKCGDIATHNWPDAVNCSEVGPFHLTNNGMINELGPFNLSPEERVATSHDKAVNNCMQRKAKTKKDLLDNLQAIGVMMPRGRSHSLKELQDLAVRKEIATEKEVAIIREEWLGKPKGLLQICCERGLIDPNNLSKYSKTGYMGLNGEVDQSTSLSYLLAQCQDFQNELTHLEVLASRIGVKVDFTPKFHPELADEGIEYSWAHAKGSYRIEPFALKRRRKDFQELVGKSTSRDNLTSAHIRKYSARARAYICTYHYLSMNNNQNGFSTDSPLLFDEIEKLAKKFKTYRCAYDFDKDFVGNQC